MSKDIKPKGKAIFGSITPLSSLGKRYNEIFHMSKEELSKIGFEILPMYWDEEKPTDKPSVFTDFRNKH